jgi:flagellar assembly protein FliH
MSNEKDSNEGNDELDAKIWHIPDVRQQLTEVEETKTNAFGIKSPWRYEAPEEIETVELPPLTAEEIEEIRQAAFNEGFNQGKEDGFTKGYEEGKAEGLQAGILTGHKEGLINGLDEGQETIAEWSAKWSCLVNELHQPMINIEKNVEEQLLQLVVQLTEAVVLHEIKTNPDILIAAISTGIKALPSQEVQTQIYCHPDDIKLIEKEFGAERIKDSGWRLLPTPQLAVGSCQIENSTSSIDLSVKSRLKQVLESFLENALYHAN